MQKLFSFQPLLFYDSVLAEPRRYFIRQVWSASIMDGQALGQGGVWHKFSNGREALSKASIAVTAKRENDFTSKIVYLKE
jgi:hypothetical protein